MFAIKVPVPELAPKLPCAAYDALKAWLPALGLVIVNVVDPLTSPCAGKVVLSTLNDTLPAGVPAAPELTVTVTKPFAPYVIVAGGVIVVVVVARPTLNWPDAEHALKLPCASNVAYKI